MMNDENEEGERKAKLYLDIPNSNTLYLLSSKCIFSGVPVVMGIYRYHHPTSPTRCNICNLERYKLSRLLFGLIYKHCDFFLHSSNLQQVETVSKLANLAVISGSKRLMYKL